MEDTSPLIGNSLAYKLTKFQTNEFGVEIKIGRAGSKTVVNCWLVWSAVDFALAAAPKTGNHTFVQQVGVQV